MNRKRTSTKKRNVSADKVEYLQSQILNFLNRNLNRTFTVKQILKKLQANDQKSKVVATQLIYRLANEGSITRLSNGCFKSNKKVESVVGKVDHVNPNFGYILTPEGEEDIWVKTEDLNFALDGDLVKVIIHKISKRGKPEGKVVEILERARDEFVGRVEIAPNYAFVIPDNRKMHLDIYIEKEHIAGAKNDDKVVVKITEWHTANRNPVGVIKEILGKAGDNEAEIHSIMAEFGLPFRFPEHVLEEANNLKTTISNAEIKNRRDLRNVTTFTIDPEDAKDFDDALSIQKLANGNYEIGIHIADVTHYVRPGSEMEKEAVKRATSVYLVDRTIPMLPEKISNELCSLRPNEEKLTFSAIFEINKQAEVLHQWFGKALIYSDRRFTYEEAQQILDEQQGEFSDELLLLNGLAKKLRHRRFRQGAVNFETIEVRFNLDENGKPLGIIPKVRKDAHKLIEEFMLLANRLVAEHVSKLLEKKEPKTFVYRVHENPDTEKLDSFAKFARRFGHQLNFEQGGISQQLNNLISAIEGKPEQNVLESLAVRSMAKARYTTENKGHFGLAFSHYTHFTSPIRRYPDMMVHRLLWNYLKNNEPPKEEEYNKQCEHSSQMEKNAADAERASIKYKQVEFMSSMLGQDFDGLIAGLTEWGMFVEIVETKCEGMVRISDIEDDFYEFDEKNYCIVGLNNKKVYTLGDQVKVRVMHTDIDRRTIDLQLVLE